MKIPTAFGPDDPFMDIIREQILLEERIARTETKEVSIWGKSTYTPTYEGSVTPGVTTYATQSGFWRRVNSLVFFSLRLIWTAATGTGNAQVSIPFTALNVANEEYAVGIWSSGLTFANGNVVGRILENQSFFTFQSLLTNAGPTATAVEAAGDIIVSGWYTSAF